VKIAQGADILIHDSTFVDEEVSEKKRKAHPSVKETVEIAKRANVKKLILTHFSRRYKDINEFLDPARKIFANTEAARDFMRISLKTGPDRK
jgi:ribonuclease Z